MAMVKCKECKKDVSSKAKVCPHCGVKDPAVTTMAMIGAVVFLVVLVWIVVDFLSGDADPAVSSVAESEAPPALIKTPEQIEAELEVCKRNIKCWGDKYNIHADIRCDEYIEKLANYSFEWTDGWLDPKLSHFRWMSIDEGFITYIGDKIKFQNGYGAWQNMVYECDYNPEADQVIDVRVEPGRL